MKWMHKFMFFRAPKPKPELGKTLEEALGVKKPRKNKYRTVQILRGAVDPKTGKNQPIRRQKGPGRRQRRKLGLLGKPMSSPLRDGTHFTLPATVLQKGRRWVSPLPPLPKEPS